MEQYVVQALFTSNEEEKFYFEIENNVILVSPEGIYKTLFVLTDKELAEKLMNDIVEDFKKRSIELLLGKKFEAGWFDIELIEDGKLIKNFSFFKTEND